MYDLFFLSYNEDNIETKWKKFKERFIHAKHISGIKGIYNAHKECSQKSNTSMFYVVDADNEILDFDFLYKPNKDLREYVHVWRCKNPLNNLIYGYGGVKLFPKNIFSLDNNSYLDMTTTIAKKFHIQNDCISITNFNTSPFNTWKGAFRECVKLSSKKIKNNKDEMTENRLHVWKTIANGNYSDWCLKGANDGYEYGTNNIDNDENLIKINDFDWLNITFKNKYGDII